MPDSVLKQNELERFRPVKKQVVYVDNCLDALRQLDVDARVVNVDPWIDEIRLPLNLAAAQTRQQTVWLDQAHAGLGQTDPVAHPKRKLTAGKIRIVEDRIEPVGSLFP